MFTAESCAVKTAYTECVLLSDNCCIARALFRLTRDVCKELVDSYIIINGTALVDCSSDSVQSVCDTLDDICAGQCALSAINCQGFHSERERKCVDFYMLHREQLVDIHIDSVKIVDDCHGKILISYCYEKSEQVNSFADSKCPQRKILHVHQSIDDSLSQVIRDIFGSCARMHEHSTICLSTSDWRESLSMRKHYNNCPLSLVKCEASVTIKADSAGNILTRKRLTIRVSVNLQATDRKEICLLIGDRTVKLVHSERDNCYNWSTSQVADIHNVDTFLDDKTLLFNSIDRQLACQFFFI